MDELLSAEILEALERGATVVTGNQRTARTLQRGFNQWCRKLGRPSWQPPIILAWDAWTAGLWHKLLIAGHEERLLLNRSQEHAVWRKVLEADENLLSLKTHDALSEMGSEAWHLLCSYEGQKRLRRESGNSDTRSFQRWASVLEQVCRAEKLCTQAQLESVLCDAVENGHIQIDAKEIILVGFDVLTPARGKLADALQSADVLISQLQPTAHSESRLLIEASDEREELRTAAQWLRYLLEKQPGTRVAVIVPNLERERREIDRVFREVLAPELENIQAEGNSGPYEFSLGVSLAEMGVVATALDLLRWSVGALPLERVSHLLLSPYFAMEDKERGARAEFDAFVLRKKRMLRPEITLEKISQLIHSAKMPRLAAVLRRMVAVVIRLNINGMRTHADWSEKIREFLEAAAWDAPAGKASVEFQTRQSWEGALDELATLDFDSVKVEYAQALAALERIAKQTVFAPESREAPVQVMGPLEAAGGKFDAIWFLRAGELSWPMETHSNSLLPWALQRELGMPGTDVTRDSDDARRMTQRIAASAATMIFSYAKEIEGSKQGPSPVLTGLDLEEIEAGKLIRNAPEPPTITLLEDVEDSAHVSPLPDQIIHGGARILELQAACSFRAFAERRLWATELETNEPGMDARESGTAVHKALELFWAEIRTQDELRSMLPEEREVALEWCITKALKRTEDLSETTWDAAYLDVQCDRLRKLLSSWLELELNRELPFEVKVSEKEFEDVQIGPLRLHVRMDRIDMVEGGEVLIDYKTGNASPNDWLGERPDAPQLPLYAILSEAERLQGVAFALVRAGEERDMKGYAVGPGIIPKPAKLKEAATLEAQVEQWRTVLIALAEEFARGEARVKPKKYPATCQHCKQRLLCRLNVADLEEEDEDGETSGEIGHG